MEIFFFQRVQSTSNSYCSLRITNLRRGAATLSAPFIDSRKEWIGRELALSAKERAARRDARREAERVDVFLRTARVAAIRESPTVANGEDGPIFQRR